ncbi:hypothetical protein BD560DRAFT_401805 [Blakeslea trispora]|nr:hypothetical protein BD560DRAFT_401805 [Blakeslea trispora]
MCKHSDESRNTMKRAYIYSLHVTHALMGLIRYFLTNMESRKATVPLVFKKWLFQVQDIFTI